MVGWGRGGGRGGQGIYEMFDTEPAIADFEGGSSPLGPGLARPSGVTPGAGVPGPAAPSGPRGRLVFDHVAFRYPGAPAPVLRDVSLELEPGETVAIVGPHGAGKTTLLQLLPTLAQGSGGSVRLDGTHRRGP